MLDWLRRKSAIKTEDRATVLVTNQIGKRRALTPEGYLLCEEARLARLGELHYRPEEIPVVRPGTNPFLTITRDGTALFDLDAIASFEGKPVTNEHPPEMLDPETHKRFSVGTIMNVRRGEGAEAMFLMGDLLITDAAAIQEIMDDNKTELSLGYFADYEELRPGYGRQTNIRGNHVALVMKGRCGPICAIQDSGDPDMAKTLRERIRNAFKTKDEAAMEQVLTEMPEAAAEEEKDPFEQIMSRLDALEAKLGEHGASMQSMRDEMVTAMKRDEDKDEGDKDEKLTKDSDDKDEDKDKDEGTKDSDDKDEDKDEPNFTKDAASIFAAAEVLAPGIKLPKVDKSSSKATMDALVALQRDALTQATKHTTHSRLIAPVLGSKAQRVNTLPVRDLATVFTAAAEVIKAHNRAAATKDSRTPPTGTERGACSPAGYQDIIRAKREAVSAVPNSGKR